MREFMNIVSDNSVSLMEASHFDTLTSKEAFYADGYARGKNWDDAIPTHSGHPGLGGVGPAVGRYGYENAFAWRDGFNAARKERLAHGGAKWDLEASNARLARLNRRWDGNKLVKVDATAP